MAVVSGSRVKPSYGGIGRVGGVGDNDEDVGGCKARAQVARATSPEHA